MRPTHLVIFAALAACAPASSDIDEASAACACSQVSGSDGVDGAPGANGSDGAPGIDGADGTDGANGLTGADGVQGTQGATGPAGSTGAAGANGANGSDGLSAPGWADADGVRVLDGSELIYIDGDGYEWAPDRETGLTHTTVGSMVVYYENAGCSGTSWTVAFEYADGVYTWIPAMQPFEISNDPGTYARPVDLQPDYTLSADSFSYGVTGSCVGLWPTYVAAGYRLSDLSYSIFRTPPVLTYAPPLHRVR